jgi:hypothetical protein
MRRRRGLAFALLAALTALGGNAYRLSRRSESTIERDAASPEVALKPARAGVETRSSVPKFQPEELGRKQLVLGKTQTVTLEVDRLRLTRVWQDGTTQYRYDDETIVTILPSGEVLLVPDRI